MAIVHDIFAETNPAYCACLLASFVRAYRTRSGSDLDTVLCYTALPLALSGGLASTFGGTDRRTGLLEWLRRNPAVQIRLAARVNGSLDIVTEAIRFACFGNVLVMNSEGRIVPGVSAMPKHLLAKMSQDIQTLSKNIDRLGNWIAMVGSTRMAFDMMGQEL